ncbi:Spy/CpxP family protein refolding chaperone [Pseudodesulfovibrio sp.]|uniref:Spy/CpxP family protein refolding chaperone n=1 Tax=unclassified Pseudodesulfovibrio TaxID=2661612 RepID=UPI003B009575
MTRKNFTSLALAMALVMAVAGFALAGPGGHGYNGRGGCGAWSGGQGGPGLRGMYSQLTPEKRASVDKIFENYKPKFEALRNQMQTKHAMLEAMVNGGQADENKIGKLIGDMTQLRDKMFDLRKSLSADLSKELGVELPAVGFGQGCPGFGPDGCPEYGTGYGMGSGYGHGMGGHGMGGHGYGHRWQ